MSVTGKLGMYSSSHRANPTFPSIISEFSYDYVIAILCIGLLVVSLSRITERGCWLKVGMDMPTINFLHTSYLIFYLNPIGIELIML